MAGTVYITEAEAARDFGAVMRLVRAGEEVVVEDAAGPVAVLKASVEKVERGDSSGQRHGRTVAEAVERLRSWERQHGAVTMDSEFADDLEEIHRHYNRPISDPWA